MTDKTIKHNDKGNFDDLKINAVDPSDIVNDPTDARNGLPRFLVWEPKKDENGEEYHEAIGKDGKIYRVVSDETPKPKKKGKVVIT